MKMKNEIVKNERILTSGNEFFEEEIEKNIEKALYITSRDYGEIYEIIEQNGDSKEGEYLIKERKICFQETFRVLNQLSFYLPLQQEVIYVK